MRTVEPEDRNHSRTINRKSNKAFLRRTQKDNREPFLRKRAEKTNSKFFFLKACLLSLKGHFGLFFPVF